MPAHASTCDTRPQTQPGWLTVGSERGFAAGKIGAWASETHSLHMWQWWVRDGFARRQVLQKRTFAPAAKW